jgi:hypothetical protein
VRPAHPSYRAFAWFWMVLELANGVGHTILAVSRGGYFPGVGTAPVLIAVSLYLGAKLSAGPIPRDSSRLMRGRERKYARCWPPGRFRQAVRGNPSTFPPRMDR